MARLFPDALDYVDVYDRAGGLGSRTVLAHAVHLSDRELDRLVETGARVAHCPISNLFLASGMMPLGRYLEAGLPVGLGSDVAGGPDLSIFAVMRVGFYAQNARKVAGVEAGPVLGPLDWLRTRLARRRPGARARRRHRLARGRQGGRPHRDRSGLRRAAGGRPADDDPTDLASRLIFRAHPDMVRAAWVRGRRLEGPGARG